MGWGAILGAGLQIGAGALTKHYAATAARKAFRRAREFRQTAYQDTVLDLRKAGLNPILAFGKGPTTSGMPHQARVPDIAQGLTSSALAAGKMRSELKILQAQAELVRQQSLKTEAERRNILSDPKKKLFRTLFDPETREKAMKSLKLTVDGVDTVGEKVRRLMSEQWRAVAERFGK